MDVHSQKWFFENFSSKRYAYFKILPSPISGIKQKKKQCKIMILNTDSSAGKYLGLIYTEKMNGRIACFLTESGKRMFSYSIYDRQIEFIKLILSHTVFRETLKIYFRDVEMPGKSAITEIMKKSNLYGIDSDSTYFRRASTITGWINWIMNQIEE